MNNIKIKKIGLIILMFSFVITTVSCGKSASSGEGAIAKKDNKATAKIINLKEKSGVVEVGRAEEDFDAYEDMNFESGDHISTDTESYAVMGFDDVRYAFLVENSVADIVSADYDQGLCMKLSEGGLYTNLEGGLNNMNSYEIHTPNAIMGVRGTKFTVSCQETDGIVNTSVKVIEGEVSVTLLDKDGNPLEDEEYSIKAEEEGQIYTEGEEGENNTPKIFIQNISEGSAYPRQVKEYLRKTDSEYKDTIEIDAHIMYGSEESSEIGTTEVLINNGDRYVIGNQFGLWMNGRDGFSNDPLKADMEALYNNMFSKYEGQTYEFYQKLVDMCRENDWLAKYIEDNKAPDRVPADFLEKNAVSFTIDGKEYNLKVKDSYGSLFMQVYTYSEPKSLPSYKHSFRGQDVWNTPYGVTYHFILEGDGVVELSDYVDSL